MGKSTNFNGQPIFNQLLMFLDKGQIKRISKTHDGDRYVKKFTSYTHIVVMLFTALEGYSSIREVIVGLFANAHKLSHLGLSYIVKRSTLSEANARRSSKLFGEVYMEVYKRNRESLTDSQLKDSDMKRLYIMDSTTITLFKDILKGVGRNPLQGKKKGGIKAHTIIKASENVPCLIRYSAAVRHDHTFLKEIHTLPKGSIITFDKGYVDYAQYEAFSQNTIFYVTRLKDNAVYKARMEYGIPDNASSAVLKDEEIFLNYGQHKKEEHRTRRIAYWDDENKRLFEFISNNFELSAEKIALIYKQRWQIELLFKQLKQNFQLKYFLGDNENAIEIQIWAAMLANLLITLVKSKVKRSWAFSNMMSLIRNQLMNYVNIYSFLEDPEGCWREVTSRDGNRYENSLFSGTGGLAF